MTHGQINTVQAILLQDQRPRSGQKAPAGVALMQQIRQADVVKDITEPEFGISGHPAITLRHVTIRIDTDELVGTVILPDSEQVPVSVYKIVE